MLKHRLSLANSFFIETFSAVYVVSSPKGPTFRLESRRKHNHPLLFWRWFVCWLSLFTCWLRLCLSSLLSPSDKSHQQTVQTQNASCEIDNGNIHKSHLTKWTLAFCSNLCRFVGVIDWCWLAHERTSQLLNSLQGFTENRYQKDKISSLLMSEVRGHRGQTGWRP